MDTKAGDGSHNDGSVGSSPAVSLGRVTVGTTATTESGRLRRQHMRVRDFMEMSPWDKWRVYGKIPWKSILAIIIVSCVTALVIIGSQRYSPYVRNTRYKFQQLLIPETGNGTYTVEDPGFRRTHHLTNSSEFIRTLKKSLTLYFEIQTTAVGLLQYNQRTAQGNPATTMTTKSYTAGMAVFGQTDDHSITTTQYEIDRKGDLGPFTNLTGAALQHSVNTLESVNVDFRLRGFNLNSDVRQCFDWTVSLVFDFVSRGQLEFQVFTNGDPCGINESSAFIQAKTGLLIGLIIACVLSQVLHIRSFGKSIRLFIVLRRRMQQERARRRGAGYSTRGTVSVGFWDLYQLLHKWYTIDLCSNVMNIFVGVYFLSRPKSDIFEIPYVIAFAVFLAWIKLMQFYTTDTSYGVLFSTLSVGLPRVVGTLLRVLPLYVGYVMLGLALFADCSEFFRNSDEVSITLFSILNGDSIEDVFRRCVECQPTLGRLYVYFFVAFVICVVLNVLLVFIEDSFFETKAFQIDQDRTAARREAERLQLIEWLDVDDDDDDATSITTRPDLEDLDMDTGAAVSRAAMSRKGTTDDSDTSFGYPDEFQNWVKMRAPSPAAIHADGSPEGTMSSNQRDGGSGRGSPAIAPVPPADWNSNPSPIHTASSAAGSDSPSPILSQQTDSQQASGEGRSSSGGPSLSAGAAGGGKTGTHSSFSQSTTATRGTDRKKKRNDFSMSARSARDEQLQLSFRSSARSSASGGEAASSARHVRTRSYKRQFMRDMQRSRSSQRGGDARTGEAEEPGGPQVSHSALEFVIAKLTELLTAFSTDLRSELVLYLRGNMPARILFRSLADEHCLHSPADFPCGRAICLQCNFRDIGIRRARMTLHTFVRTVNRVRRKMQRSSEIRKLIRSGRSARSRRLRKNYPILTVDEKKGGMVPSRDQKDDDGSQSSSRLAVPDAKGSRADTASTGSQELLGDPALSDASAPTSAPSTVVAREDGSSARGSGD